MSRPTQLLVRNLLLKNMTAEDFDLLQPHLQFTVLPVQETLIARDEPIQHATFIESGLGSVVASNEGGEEIEVGHVGYEGMTGKALVSGSDRSPHRTFMQVAGAGFRIDSVALTDAMRASSSLARLLSRYCYAMHCQIADTALANGRYDLHQRLARWLLMCHDRLEGDDLPITHDFLAMMLGVRRAGVTVGIHIIEGLQAIKATRANIRIRDRATLEEVANGSYGLAERHYERLVGVPVRRMSPRLQLVQ